MALWVAILYTPVSSSNALEYSIYYKTNTILDSKEKSMDNGIARIKTELYH